MGRSCLLNKIGAKPKNFKSDVVSLKDIKWSRWPRAKGWVEVQNEAGAYRKEPVFPVD